MSELVLVDAKIWLAQHDLSADLNAVTFERTRDGKETTRFGSGGHVTRLPGLRMTRSTVEGLWNSDPGRLEEAAFARADDEGLPYSVSPRGVEGEPAYSVLCQEASIGLGAPIGEPVPMSVEMATTGRCFRGPLALFGTKTATGSGSVFDLGSTVGATQRLYAALHILDYVGGGSLTMRVQGDDLVGFGSPTTRLTFNALSAVGSQFLSVPGAIAEAFYRADWTFTGTSFRAALVVGIA